MSRGNARKCLARRDEMYNALLRPDLQRDDQALADGNRIAIGNAVGCGEVFRKKVICEGDSKQVFAALDNVHVKAASPVS